MKDSNEAARLHALTLYDILDTGREDSYDDLTKLAAYICAAPIALVTLIDEDRQWFKSEVGLPELSETPRDIAFCDRTIRQADLFIVPDALADPRFADNPLVVGDPYIRFYAGAPLTTADGYSLGALCIIDQVPRELNGEQKDALRRLARQVVSLLELRRANQIAVESERFKSQFLANMSHEIRTPLNGVIGMADLLIDTNLPAEQRRFAEVIKSSADALLTVVNDILDFSKLDAGKLQLDPQPFEVSGLVEKTIDLFGSIAQSKGLEIAAFTAADVPRRIRADEGRIRQILTNLLGNALKFTEVGQVTLSLEVASRDGNEVMLEFSVADTGIGIRPSAQERLFAPFVQGSSSTHRRYGGTGLGLMISKQLAELMGGSIGLESVEGSGSRFWFTVRAELVDEQNITNRARLADLKVLVVDSDERVRSTIVRSLCAWSVPHELAQNGTQAMSALEIAANAGKPFDVALVGAVLSDMSGFELARDVKASVSTRMVLVTGSRGVKTAQEGALFSGTVTKPVQQSQLFNAMANAAHETERDIPEVVVPQELPPKGRGHVLVADDNATNRLVARAQLERLGYSVDVVGSGREAVAAAMTGAFDAILMDCEMADLDGYEATALIRESGDFKHVPIIALTANAQPSERQKCLDAGMDDYLSKPFRPEQLRLTLVKWIEPDADGAQIRATLHELKEQVGAETVRELTVLFEADARRYLSEIEAAIVQRDAIALASRAHALRGAAANFKARTVVALSGRLEQQAEIYAVEPSGFALFEELSAKVLGLLAILHS
ncbi:MAG: hypothetical protein NVSMB31_17790 [Vulcanimicrobiaceae bacterium]